MRFDYYFHYGKLHVWAWLGDFFFGFEFHFSPFHFVVTRTRGIETWLD